MDSIIEFETRLKFHGCNDLTFRIGPLIITSISKEEDEWGSFEILWDKVGFLYCHLYEEMDSYKRKLTGFTCPEWLIQKLQTSKTPWYETKTLWSSTPLLIRFWDWYHNIKTKFSV